MSGGLLGSNIRYIKLSVIYPSDINLPTTELYHFLLFSILNFAYAYIFLSSVLNDDIRNLCRKTVPKSFRILQFKI